MLNREICDSESDSEASLLQPTSGVRRKYVSMRGGGGGGGGGRALMYIPSALGHPRPAYAFVMI